MLCKSRQNVDRISTLKHIKRFKGANAVQFLFYTGLYRPLDPKCQVNVCWRFQMKEEY